MTYDIVVEQVSPDLIAAVRVVVPTGQAGRAWKPALDQVWAFLKANPAVARDHNLFLYHHPTAAGEPMAVDFGVQVAQRFDPVVEVRCVETPSGEVARTVHAGPYDRLGDAHAAILAWCAVHGRTIGAASWETYGHWTDDPAQLETTISYLLL